MSARSILVVNAGSSSIKFALYDVGDGAPAARLSGQIEGIGLSLSLTVREGSGTVVEEGHRDHGDSTHEAAFDVLLAVVFRRVGREDLIAVSHRVVHGGNRFEGPVRVDERVLAVLDVLVPLAPLHQPHNVRGIRIMADLLPSLPQVVCFDTAFHRTMPDVAARFAIPREFAESGVRRYGFHGLSYEYIASELARQTPEIAGDRVIVAHLGNGASLCAMKGGRSVDTTMSFTPLDGVPMGTRCGAIDPGVLLYLLRDRGMTLEALEDLLYRRSGLLGVSGISNDMRALLVSGEASAAEAVDLYVYRIGQEIGALAASLQGLDALVFTAGVGERSPAIRSRICAQASWLGLEIDAAANEAGAVRISTQRSRIAVLVVPTDEEGVIIRQTMAVLGLATMQPDRARGPDRP